MFPKLRRVRYSQGMSLGKEALETEQQYFIDRLKLHNRCLHGCGVVAGLQVSLSDQAPPAVIVAPGYAIDQEGNDVIVSLAQRGPLPAGGEAAYLTLRWAERATDPVPVPGDTGAGSDLTVPSVVEEYALLEYVSDDPAARKIRLPRGGAEGKDPPGVAIARLIRKNGVWQLDLNFRPPQAAKG